MLKRCPHIVQSIECFLIVCSFTFEFREDYASLVCLFVCNYLLACSLWKITSQRQSGALNSSIVPEIKSIVIMHHHSVFHITMKRRQPLFPHRKIKTFEDNTASTRHRIGLCMEPLRAWLGRAEIRQEIDLRLTVFLKQIQKTRIHLRNNSYQSPGQFCPAS